MRKAELEPGMVVAVKTHGDYGRKAVVVATDGYIDAGYTWKSVIRPVQTPGRRTPKVAVAAESQYLADGQEIWIPQLVLPQQIVSKWEEYEERQAERRRAYENRCRQEEAALQARKAQQEELRSLIAQAGYEDRIRPSQSFYYGELKLTYAQAIEIFKELIEGKEEAFRQGQLNQLETQEGSNA